MAEFGVGYNNKNDEIKTEESIVLNIFKQNEENWEKVSARQENLNQKDFQSKINPCIISPYVLVPEESRNQHSKMVMSIPVYRKDNLHFTPGFCLSDEFVNYWIKETTEYRNEQKVLQEYRIATETEMIDVTKMQLPKPSSRNSYCTICKVRFEDYQEHISLEGHLSKMRNSPFCKHIEEMIEKKSIERFLRTNENHDEKETKIEDQKSSHIFDEGVERFERTISSDSKESLYEKISQEIIKLKVVSTQPENEFVENEIFDVLNCM